ncbi:MAG: hypothetical protein LBL07_05555 [Tannerella sp.]|jgi:hypothetical protein|nr:hypothetical protein [Tannerella sp.]
MMNEGRKPKYDTNFFERYARISLVDLVDKRFSGLRNDDCPDLQDVELSIGIEVTRAIRENKEVAHALINEIAGRPVMEVSEDEWIDMTRYGYGYGIHENLIGKIEYEYWSAALPLKRIIENKVRKVADGFYGNFAEFGLYVFSKENLTDRIVNSTISFIMKLQEVNKRKYTCMYISQIHEMFVCNLENASFDMIEITKEQCRKFYHEAIIKE